MNGLAPSHIELVVELGYGLLIIFEKSVCHELVVLINDFTLDVAELHESSSSSCIFQLLQVQLFVGGFGVLGVSHWRDLIDAPVIAAPNGVLHKSPLKVVCALGE